MNFSAETIEKAYFNIRNLILGDDNNNNYNGIYIAPIHRCSKLLLLRIPLNLYGKEAFIRK